MKDTFKLLGLKPSSECGSFFSDSKWWWHALWNYVYSTCENILTEENYLSGHQIKEGYIFPEKIAVAMAERLFDLIESGECSEYEKTYMKSIEDLPDIFDDNGDPPHKPEELMYPFTTENVKAFAEFCYHSGGFMISYGSIKKDIKKSE